MSIERCRHNGVRTGLLLLLLVGSAPAWAGVRTGVELGVNTASLSYDDDSGFPFIYWDRHWRSSFTGGVTLEVPLQDRFALTTGLRYVQEGNRVELDMRPDYNFTEKFCVVQHYLSLPVRATWRPSPSRRFFAALGPEVALLLSGRIVVEAVSPPNGARGADVTDDLNRVLLAMDAEAGTEFPFGGHTGVLTVRYAHGLTAAAKKDHWVSGWKTRGVECLLGARW